MAIPVGDYLTNMIRSGGSDLLLAAGFPPAMRIYGRLDAAPAPPLTADDMSELLQEILLPQEYDRVRDELNLDFAYEGDLPDYGRCRFRCNAYVQRNGMSVVFRLIPWEPPTLSSLNLPASLAKLTMARNGLIVVTGPAGSGKTSTMAALCRHINENRHVHMIMIEDPIEYVHRDINAIVVQRQVGVHVQSFDRALLSALREDPDVIVVGELRDLETIRLALTAAETGHLVMGTMHTTSAALTVSRIVGAFPASQQWQVRAMLADSIKAIIAQQLLPCLEGDGCVPATELMLHSDAIANLIRDERYHQISGHIESSVQRGMHLMDYDLMRLVEAGTIDANEALNRSHNKLDFANRLETRRRKAGRA